MLNINVLQVTAVPHIYILYTKKGLRKTHTIILEDFSWFTRYFECARTYTYKTLVNHMDLLHL